MPNWKERASGISGGKNGAYPGAGTFEGKGNSGDGTAGGAGASLTRDEVITGLRCCTNEERQLCFECPEDGPGWGAMCKTDLMKTAARYLEEDREHERMKTGFWYLEEVREQDQTKTAARYLEEDRERDQTKTAARFEEDREREQTKTAARYLEEDRERDQTKTADREREQTKTAARYLEEDRERENGRL